MLSCIVLYNCIVVVKLKSFMSKSSFAQKWSTCCCEVGKSNENVKIANRNGCRYSTTAATAATAVDLQTSFGAWISRQDA